MAKESSYNLQTIINDILDFSKLEAGKMTLDQSCINIRQLLDSVNDIIISKIYDKSLHYDVKIDYDVPEFLMCDANRVKQIILNLLSNAIKFTDSGDILVKVWLDRFTNKLLFSVKDTGCGIDLDNRQYLFKSFHQMTTSPDRLYEGTGLGLAIAKSLVELMKGEIWLQESSVGKGSEFRFKIDYIKCIPKESVENTNVTILSNRKVIIVDDNLANRVLLIHYCQEWGMKPTSYSSGKEALLFTKGEEFDLGLIDICMPEFDGKAFAKEFIAQNDHNKKTPLIALSSLGDSVHFENFFQRHHIKPISKNKLKKECIELICKSQGVEKINPLKGEETNELISLDYKNNTRILIAEDVYNNQRVIIDLLRHLGFEQIQVVDDGKRCIDQLSKKEFDICFIDIKMPVMTGEQVIHVIKNEHNFLKKIPYCVALTAYSLKTDKEKYISMGFDDYIPKPFELQDLVQAMFKCYSV